MAGASPLSAAVTLALDTQTLRVEIARAGQVPETHTLALGTATLVPRYFTALPPSAYALEAAIAEVEDAIMPLAAQLPPAARWSSTSPAVRALATTADGLTLEAVEQHFRALADWAEGRPATQGGVVPEAPWCATVLLLRECMHHWRIAHLALPYGPN